MMSPVKSMTSFSLSIKPVTSFSLSIKSMTSFSLSIKFVYINSVLQSVTL